MATIDLTVAQQELAELESVIAQLEATVSSDVAAAEQAGRDAQKAIDAADTAAQVASARVDQLQQDQTAHDSVISQLKTDIDNLKAKVAPPAPPPVALSVDVSGVPTTAALSAAYTGAIAAAGGTGPYTYSASGLPDGVSLDSTSGALSGTPGTAGSFSVSVTATDSAGATASGSVTISVA